MAGSLCPECGTPRRDAVADGPLGEASQGYLQRLRRGLRLLFWGLVAELVIGVTWLVGAVTYAIVMADPTATSTTATQLASQALFESLGIFIRLAPLGIQAIGAWIYMQPELEHVVDRRQNVWRWLTLAGFAGVIAGTGAVAVLTLLGFATDPFADSLTVGQRTQAWTVTGIEVPAACGATLALVASLGFTQRLADRADDTHLESHVRGMKWGLLVLLPVGGCVPWATWAALIICAIAIGRMLSHVKYALASKPEIEVEEFVHSRPLS